MASRKLNVVLSQTQSKNPMKRALEEEIAAALLMEPRVDLSIVPHLYDLTKDHTGLLFLSSVTDDMVVLAWLYPRAIHWQLDRLGVKGHMGEVLLRRNDEDEADAEQQDDEQDHAEGNAPIGASNVPDRRIYSLDLRDFESPEPYLKEIRRIAAENRIETVQLEIPCSTDQSQGGSNGPLASAQPSGSAIASHSPAESRDGDLGRWIGGEPAPEQLARFQEPKEFLDPTDRRWNPVIDFSRCTNCMECIDFCLFGVYGVDAADRILVEQPDNCKKGCPACSRVCPEHAIIFPMHKTPEIAGAPGEKLGGLKIDLSKLFGGGSALEIAAQERDTELVKDGRDAVGLSVGIPKRQAGKVAAAKDQLDGLIDQLDELEL